MAKHPRAVLLDANLMLLAIVGQFDHNLVGRKRLEIFAREDLDLLLNLIAPYTENLTTPHILTEVNNLSDYCIPKSQQRQFRGFMAELISAFDEQWIKATKLCQLETFLRLGLTDAAVCQLASEQVLILSTDAELCAVLWGLGLNVENFNHLRNI